MGKNVLVVAAHPDDEVLGCGGTIARHSAEGDQVSVVFMADGVTARKGADEQAGKVRSEAMLKASEILGVKDTHSLGFPDNRMDSIPLLDVVQSLETLLESLQPEVVYTHHSEDLNIDHRVTHRAVLTACRPFLGQVVREIYSFEVLSATDWGGQPFSPNVFVDITSYLDVKLAALQAYEVEMRAEPHTRSLANVRRLAEMRGAGVGLWAAEGFCLVRNVKSFMV